MSFSAPRSIVVATDLSPHADHALRAASALAAASGARLHVMHAFEGDSPHYGRGAYSPDPIRAAERALDAQIERAIGASACVESRTVEPYAADRAILNHADEHDADLIVLGSSARWGYRPPWLKRHLMERVLHWARTPCLVVIGPLRLPLQRIVVPVDLAEPVPPSIACALGWAEAFGRPDGPFDDGDEVEVRVVHVLTETVAAELGIERVPIGSGLHPLVRAALHCSAPPSGVGITQELLLASGPGRSIAQYAAGHHADLIVLAKEGGPALRHWFGRGSIPAVLRSHPCGVLILSTSTSVTESAPLSVSTPRVARADHDSRDPRRAKVSRSHWRKHPV